MSRIRLEYIFGYDAENDGSTGPNPPGGWLTPLCEYVATNQTDPSKSFSPGDPILFSILDYIDNGSTGYSCTGASGAPEEQIKYQLYKCYLERINETMGFNAENPMVGSTGSWDPYIDCVDNLPPTPPY